MARPPPYGRSAPRPSAEKQQNPAILRQENCRRLRIAAAGAAGGFGRAGDAESGQDSRKLILRRGSSGAGQSRAG